MDSASRGAARADAMAGNLASGAAWATGPPSAASSSVAQQTVSEPPCSSKTAACLTGAAVPYPSAAAQTGPSRTKVIATKASQRALFRMRSIPRKSMPKRPVWILILIKLNRGRAISFPARSG